MNGMKAISIIGLLLLVGHWLNGQGISWQLTESGGKRVLQLSGLSNDQLTTADGLQLYVGTLQQWPGAEQNSILGEVSQERGALVFHPRFPFRSGAAVLLPGLLPLLAPGRQRACTLEYDANQRSPGGYRNRCELDHWNQGLPHDPAAHLDCWGLSRRLAVLCTASV